MGAQTFIAGLSAGALIAPWVIKGAMDGEAFAAYVEQVLVPKLTPETVVSLEPRHPQERRRGQGYAGRGMLVLVLAAIQPDLNPIEMAFSKVKAHLRRIGDQTFTDMFQALTEICDLFSPDECWNYFNAAGYVSG